MKQQLVIATLLSSALLSAQQVTDRRSAEIRGGGGDGKCTIEVEVDDVAEVEIFGRNAQIRTLSGSPAVFRRFQCNQEMPNNAYDFRFKGIDGRGRQDLLRSPGRGPAVIRIEDSKGGREGYTFDIFWRGGTGPWTGGGNNGGGNNGGGFGGGNGGGIFGGGNNGNNGGGWGNNNNGWGNNWGNNGELNFSGRGNGDYRDSRGRSGRLYDPQVRISRNGSVDISFESDQGRLTLNGRVERVSGNQVVARVSGGNLRGDIELQINGRDRVRRIYMQDNGPDRYTLNWRD